MGRHNLARRQLNHAKTGGSIMNDPERAVALFSPEVCCSQTILTVFGEPYGLHPELATSLGRAFAGGMGRLGHTCGAVSAAALVLALAKKHVEEPEARKICWSAVQELFKRFEVLHGTTQCRDLLGADWMTEEGMRKIEEGQLNWTVCPAFVRDAAVILADMLRPG
jgi:C_GCAxxG_C_C family probable redox protein